MGEDVFRKYDEATDTFRGAFLISAFEVIALGLSNRLDPANPPLATAVAEKIKTEVWREAFLTSTGVRASQRIPRTVALGRQLFA